MTKRRMSFFAAIVFMGGLACSSAPDNQAAAVLEAVKDAGGWKRNSEIRTYVADNLWEYINGAAEQFVVYGVRDVATADYVSDSGVEMTVDVYEMKDPLMAFGVYSMERNTAGPHPPVGGEGCWNGTSLFFHKAEFYVKMIAFDEDEELRPTVQGLAERIAAAVPGEAWRPDDILKTFPPEGLTQKSEKYYPANVLAQPFFSNGFTAQYAIGGVDVQAFIIFAESPEAAEKSFGEYRRSLENGERKFTGADTGEESFVTTDSFYGHIMAARSGSVTAGAMGQADTGAMKELAAKLLSNGASVTAPSNH